jgi:Tfp pilus assembly protein PilO
MSGHAADPSVSSKPRFNPWKLYASALLTCGALSAGGYWLGISPAMARAAHTAADRAELAERRKQAGELSAAATAARAELLVTRDALAALPLKLEPASAVNQRLARLTDMAAESSLSVAEVRPGTLVEGRDFDSVPIAIAGTGTYPACAAFLHRLHERFPDIAVRSFRAGQGEANAGSASFGIDLVWHTARKK